eukprot:3407972-Pyramimonas_sp.AAC.1
MSVRLPVRGSKHTPHSYEYPNGPNAIPIPPPPTTILICPTPAPDSTAASMAPNAGSLYPIPTPAPNSGCAIWQRFRNLMRPPKPERIQQGSGRIAPNKGFRLRFSSNTTPM